MTLNKKIKILIYFRHLKIKTTYNNNSNIYNNNKKLTKKQNSKTNNKIKVLSKNKFWKINHKKVQSNHLDL